MSYPSHISGDSSPDRSAEPKLGATPTVNRRPDSFLMGFPQISSVWPRISTGLLKPLVIGSILCAVWGGAALLSIVSLWAQDLPSVETLSTPNRPVNIQILDRRGRDIAVRGAETGAPVNMDDLPPYVKTAILSTEDRRFYSHVGLDPQGLLRAAFANLHAGRVVQGGSTLTQQLSKNVFLTPDKTYKRKGQEMLLSLWLEHKFTKAEILNLYANRVYFGNGTWGLRAASENYFHKDPKDLTLSEAALLAGLLKAPSRFNPLAHPERSSARVARVLDGMARNGVIDREQHYLALIAPIDIKRRVTEDSANYFVDWIWSEIERLSMGWQSDIIVQTTLDRDTQIAAHRALNAHLQPERGANQGAVLTLDGTGAVRAMVGGRSYPESQFNRVTQAKRQPGSAFKPMVYLSAIESGMTPWDWVEDAPIQLGDWTPGNFSNRYKGVMTVESAFAQSINTVAVSLQETVGRDAVIKTAKRLGLPEMTPLRSLALGAQLTTPLELSQAYLPFANWGHYQNAYGILSISTQDGKMIYNHSPQTAPTVVDPVSLGHMNRLFFETVERGTARKARIEGREIGGKTGTTNDYRDAWFIGFVPDLLTAVWVGSDDNLPMDRLTGGSQPALIFKDTMQTALIGQSFTRLPVSEPPLIRQPPHWNRFASSNPDRENAPNEGVFEGQENTTVDLQRYPQATPRSLAQLLQEIEDSLP